MGVVNKVLMLSLVALDILICIELVSK